MTLSVAVQGENDAEPTQLLPYEKVIGISGVGHATTGVRRVPIAASQNEPRVEIARRSVADGGHRFAWYLYVSLNKQPGIPLVPVEREFLELVLSKAGQQAVQPDGYIALNENIVARELIRLCRKMKIVHRS